MKGIAKEWINTFTDITLTAYDDNAQLTDQIVKLNINLAQQQQPQPAYITKTETNSSKASAICYYCRKPNIL
ncbi:24275_t:CDS:2 [Gigaspora margarita]|uniref:24275_t:CDS:1 n=1 Tax=Gigaspora margarita TaxID=4874 RepID=A0ABN7W712_GIGMA|nr:24275_t:CDS:2 [Gigaspora margarita]